MLYQLSYASAFLSPESGRRDSNPRPTAWKAVTLPTELLPRRYRRSSTSSWAGKDSNLRRPKPTDLQSVAVDRFATCPHASEWRALSLVHAAHCCAVRRAVTRAGDQNRTGDLLITSQLLYQLSYASMPSCRSTAPFLASRTIAALHVNTLPLSARSSLSMRIKILSPSWIFRGQGGYRRHRGQWGVLTFKPSNIINFTELSNNYRATGGLFFPLPATLQHLPNPLTLRHRRVNFEAFVDQLKRYTILSV